MKDTQRTEELREDLAGIPSEAQIWKLFKKLEDMERELNAVTEQRDRLAEALQHVAEGSSCCACRGSAELVSIAEAAIQSLTTNEQ